MQVKSESDNVRCHRSDTDLIPGLGSVSNSIVWLLRVCRDYKKTYKENSEGVQGLQNLVTRFTRACEAFTNSNPCQWSQEILINKQAEAIDPQMLEKAMPRLDRVKWKKTAIEMEESRKLGNCREAKRTKHCNVGITTTCLHPTSSCYRPELTLLRCLTSTVNSSIANSILTKKYSWGRNKEQGTKHVYPWLSHIMWLIILIIISFTLLGIKFTAKFLAPSIGIATLTGFLITAFFMEPYFTSFYISGICTEMRLLSH